MKKWMKKTVAVGLTAAVAVAVGVSMFAEEKPVTTETMLAIVDEMNQKYDVELIFSEENKTDAEITEGEYRLRAELMAIMAAHMEHPSDELLEKRDVLVQRLNEEYL